jgi:hypothetical protein
MRNATHGRGKASHTFALTPQIHSERSMFDRSFGHKTTFNEGYLIPIFVDEVLPGDTFNLNMTAVCRMATPIFPIMDNLYFQTQFWFCPARLVWNHFVNFMGEQASPSDTTQYVVPQVVSGSSGFLINTIADYFGIPINTAHALSVNALPFRCHNLIYNQWYRDENLQNGLTVQTDDGPDTLANYTLQRRGKRHDYFTSCLPWPQKINDGTVVEIPLGSTAPVITTGQYPHMVGNNDPTTQRQIQANTSNALSLNGSAFGTTNNIYFGDQTGLQTDLSSATAATINQLRQAFQLQVLFERDARGGTRYTEINRSHFNVIMPDMQWRPEFLGGGSQMISINAVAQTAPSDVSGTGEQLSPQGTLAAFGVGHIHGHGFVKSFVEHGYVIGFASVRADLNYQQGLNRMWTRSTRYDFYWPSLAHIGEQTVALGEIYAVGGTVTTDGWSTADAVAFGYQERFAEYRFKPSVISSYFRSTALTGTLDAWHLAQKFTSAPSLDSTFIVENAPMSRVEAVTNVADFICDMFYNFKCARRMPLYGTPMQLGRF